MEEAITPERPRAAEPVAQRGPGWETADGPLAGLVRKMRALSPLARQLVRRSDKADNAGSLNSGPERPRLREFRSQLRKLLSP